MEIECTTLEADTPGHTWSLRVLRYRGAAKGPAVHIQAGLHAHEIPGVVAIDRLIPLLGQTEKEGRLGSDITLVPHANPIGLGQGFFGTTLGRFDFNSRLNFNRSFPPGTPESRAGRSADDRLKALLLSMAVEADTVLDLHCDTEGPVYLYTSEARLDEGRRLARAISAEFILFDSIDEVVSFDTEVSARWKAQGRTGDRRFAATLEYRGMLDVTPDLAEKDASGLYRYLVDIGAVDDTLPPAPRRDPIIGHVDDAELILTPEPGAILYHVNVSEPVAEGQRLASILAEPGAAPYDLRAPFGGVVMTRRNQRIVRRGDHVLKLLRHPGRRPDPSV